MRLVWNLNSGLFKLKSVSIYVSCDISEIHPAGVHNLHDLRHQVRNVYLVSCNFRYYVVALRLCVTVCRFSLAFSFRALQPNGILLALLSSETSARQYLIVYMHSGHIVVSMVTSGTHSVTSRYAYNDADWWKARRAALRFYRARYSYASFSLRLSVCLSHCGIMSERMHVASKFFTIW